MKSTKRVSILFFTTATLWLALVPAEGEAQLRDSSQSSTRPAPPVQDSLSVQDSLFVGGRTSIPLLRPGPGRDPFQLPSVKPLSNSGWPPRRAPLLSPARPEDLSAAQNLLWGTVGLTLTAFFESNAPRQSAWSRRTTWNRLKPGRPVPAPWPRGQLPPPQHHDRDPVRRRSMEALVEGLFNIGSYTKLK